MGHLTWERLQYPQEQHIPFPPVGCWRSDSMPAWHIVDLGLRQGGVCVFLAGDTGPKASVTSAGGSAEKDWSRIQQEFDLHQLSFACIHAIGLNTRLKALIHSRSGRMVDADCSNLISDGLCVCRAIWLKWLSTSGLTCLFQIQHVIFQMDELHLPANECPLFGLEPMKGQKWQGM